jgi:hypothetical protein
MNPSPLPSWTAVASDAAFTDADACAAQAIDFARRIGRRNRRERLAGLIQLPIWGGLAGFFLWEGEWLVGLALLLCGAGVMVVLLNLARRATTLVAQPEEPCLTHLERLYTRQLVALDSVPSWYIGPLVPGVLALFAAVTARVADGVGWIAALEGVLWPFTITFGLFAILILINRIAARTVAADLARLRTLA